MASKTKTRSQKKVWAARVLALRMRAACTQAEAAFALGCAVTTWAHWEQGVSEPDARYAAKLEDAERRRALRWAS